MRDTHKRRQREHQGSVTSGLCWRGLLSVTLGLSLTLSAPLLASPPALQSTSLSPLDPLSVSAHPAPFAEALLTSPWLDSVELSHQLLREARQRAAELSPTEGAPPPEGWPSWGAWQTWRGLQGEVELAWSLAARGLVDERWLERMGQRGPTPMSHTWPGGSDGFLLNAPRLKDSPLWDTRRYKNYATPEAITAIKAGVYALHLSAPGSPTTIIGDLSKQYGGHFPPHLSHQSGRDADIGYFVRGPLGRRLKGLMETHPRQLDVARTWAFLHGMLKTDLVEQVYIDYKLQRLLYRHAKREGVEPELLKRWFSYPYARGGVIWHLKGHGDHMHVRFKAPSSEAHGEALVRLEGRRALRPKRRYSRVRSSDTLAKVAKRHRVPLNALKRWNRLSGSAASARLNRKSLIVGFYTPWDIAKRAKFLGEQLHMKLQVTASSERFK